MIESPLNYTGGKYKLLPQILPLFPQHIGTFVDLFCGGCNVGINVEAERHLYNDSCLPLIGLFSVMQRTGSQIFLQQVQNIIRTYDLSVVSEHGYEFYGCNSSIGLGSYNKAGFQRLRENFNSLTVHDDDYYTKLYVLIVYAFNNQIRFNKDGLFNLPVGKRDFNRNMQQKLIRFMERLHTQNCTFSASAFTAFPFEELKPNDFVYADPPYLITCASYNEKGGWTENDEHNLLAILDRLTAEHVRFALSNVTESKGNQNRILSEWVNAHPEYRMISLNYSYRNSNYHRQNRESDTREVLIVNY